MMQLEKYSILKSMFKCILSSQNWVKLDIDVLIMMQESKFHGWSIMLGVEGGEDVFNLSFKAGLVNFII